MDRTRPYFFVHVMKTGGTTFRQHVKASFAAAEAYPHAELDGDAITAYTSVEQLVALPALRREVIRCYSGHFPFAATQMMGLDFVVLTILREPVARTVSYLKQCQRDLPRFADVPLDAIYEDMSVFTPNIWNYQAKIFSFTAADRPTSHRDTLEVDADRLAIAKQNLESVDVLGLADRQDEFLAELARRYGWQFGEVESQRVAPSTTVSDSLLAQIAEDNAADLELWDFAVDLYEQRRRR